MTTGRQDIVLLLEGFLLRGQKVCIVNFLSWKSSGPNIHSEEDAGSARGKSHLPVSFDDPLFIVPATGYSATGYHRDGSGLLTGKNFICLLFACFALIAYLCLQVLWQPHPSLLESKLQGFLLSLKPLKTVVESQVVSLFLFSLYTLGALITTSRIFRTQGIRRHTSPSSNQGNQVFSIP